MTSETRRKGNKEKKRVEEMGDVGEPQDGPDEPQNLASESVLSKNRHPRMRSKNKGTSDDDLTPPSAGENNWQRKRSSIENVIRDLRRQDEKRQKESEGGPSIAHARGRDGRRGEPKHAREEKDPHPVMKDY